MNGAGFKKGDVVQLKSGGPLMTIESLGTFQHIADGAYCLWFDGAKRVGDVFDVETIQHYEDES